MGSTIFYSWQSDLSNATNRGFIQTALERAVRSIRDDTSIHVEPVVDRDTIGIPGSPDIATTILQKIDHCDVFVCDVSIINSGQEQRSTPNPNVLFELGYALKRLGWGRVIMILNEAFGPVSDLPFDLRMKRVLLYSMPEEAEEKSAERRNLKTRLTSALQEIFRQTGHADGEAEKRDLLPPPQMEIVSPGSYFGRFDSKDGRFALLLKVKFHNESDQPVLMQYFRIQYMGNWQAPQLQTGNITLYASSQRFVNLLRSEDNVTVSLRIPAMQVVERYAFFLLPDLQEPFPGPGALHVTAEATFVHRDPRQLTFTLTSRGEIKPRGEADNQVAT